MSSDIAKSIVERLRADEKRLDFIEKHGVGIKKVLAFFEIKEPWMIIPNDRSYSVIAAGSTIREALDKAIAIVESQESNEQPKRHAKNRRRA